MKRFFKSTLEKLKAVTTKCINHVREYNLYAILAIVGMGLISSSAFLTDMRLGLLITGMELITLAYLIHKQTD